MDGIRTARGNLRGVAGRMLGVALGIVAGAVAACDGGPTSFRMPRELRVAIDNASGTAVTLGQDSVTLLYATGIRLRASVVGSDGKPLAGGTPAWRSTNPAVAIVARDEGGQARGEGSATVAGSMPGTTLVIASIGGVADTVTVTVLPYLDGSHRFTLPPQPERFDMSVRVQGFVRQPGDESTRVLEILGSSSVALTLLPPRPGDRIPTGTVSVAQPTLVAMAATDASGVVWFRNLPTSRYRLEILPPPGSAWTAASGEGPPPAFSLVHNEVWLRRP